MSVFLQFLERYTIFYYTFAFIEGKTFVFFFLNRSFHIFLGLPSRGERGNGFGKGEGRLSGMARRGVRVLIDDSALHPFVYIICMFVEATLFIKNGEGLGMGNLPKIRWLSEAGFCEVSVEGHEVKWVNNTSCCVPSGLREKQYGADGGFAFDFIFSSCHSQRSFWKLRGRRRRRGRARESERGCVGVIRFWFHCTSSIADECRCGAIYLFTFCL